MTDTHGNTPGGPVPPTSGDEHAQHAAHLRAELQNKEEAK